MKKVDTTKWATLQQAREITGASRQCINNWIARGKLIVDKSIMPGVTLVEKNSLKKVAK